MISVPTSPVCFRLSLELLVTCLQLRACGVIEVPLGSGSSQNFAPDHHFSTDVLDFKVRVSLRACNMHIGRVIAEEFKKDKATCFDVPRCRVRDVKGNRKESAADHFQSLCWNATLEHNT